MIWCGGAGQLSFLEKLKIDIHKFLLKEKGEKNEIQTIILATISKVNEEHILYGNYEPGEYDRVQKAIEYLASSPLYIVHIPDFNIEDIKNIIKKYQELICQTVLAKEIVYQQELEFNREQDINGTNYKICIKRVK